MRVQSVSFSIAAHAAWAPGLCSPEAWLDWSASPFRIEGAAEPAVRAMPPMLRRRAAPLGKMALEAAYACLGEQRGIPMVFSSRHGDVARAVELLGQLAHGETLSPAAFGMAVHNATAGLFSIARSERANHVALAAGASSLEHAVIEACGLLADGAPQVLLVVADCPLPEVFGAFADCDEQPFAFAWLLEPAAAGGLRLSWEGCAEPDATHADVQQGPGELDVLRFFLARQTELTRQAERRRWHWQRDV
ncbi:beta-ketoacyl synthase chain length factor [Massilia sp. erpn]|uniref:beta-ketoacyl synthase chain length factor n=1 Tax=Massilia sp. erpn TaxID=2738142 RepID=UPI0021075B39|nr:beta-ketoacyl synthase chain length factor [Massilia sp. erpn]UTY58495.1 beta-ketoacyl synthase chain length factor [Massilia sp. erpn]